MRFTQSRDPLFYRVQVVADRARVAHFAPPPRLRHRCGDTVFVDIQSKIEFFFHWCVCLFDLLNWNAPEHLSRPFVRLCSLNRSSPR